ncbi:Crp/Fnr family transcriptional regulator [Spirochaetia bacterium]|nr:Crp/Fnr family transcriptional regulator [Spirochaetia bacterium]
MAGQLQLAAVSYQKNTLIIVEGKPAIDRFFIIREGKVRLSREIEVVAEEGGNILGPGDTFGVVSAMSSHNCLETAQALTNLVLIAVKKDQYSDLIRQNTPVAMKIIRQFSRRLRFLDDALSRQNTNSEAKEDASHLLFNSGEYYTKAHRFNHAYFAYKQYVKNYPQGEHFAKIKDRLLKIALRVNSKPPGKSKSNEMELTYPADSMIFAEGEPGDCLFIIRKGSVKICKIVDNKEVMLAMLNPGDIFGEMALLENKPRMAAAMAYEECTIMTVTKANFEGLISTQPQLIARLTALLADRLWLIYKQLANTLIENPLGRIYDALQIQLEKDRIPMDIKQDYACNFGIKELVAMAGLPPEDSDSLLKRIILTKRITDVGGKLHIFDTSDVFRQAENYRRAQKSTVKRTLRD